MMGRTVAVLTGFVDGVAGSCLVDKKTRRPLPLPCFEDRYQARQFVMFCAHRGERDLTQCSSKVIENLHTLWVLCIRDNRGEVRP